MPSYHTRTVLMRLLPKYCRGMTLDAGAGRAKYKSLITTYCTRYIAVDNMSSLYQFANKRSAPLPVDILADVLQLPIRDAVFDCVVCTQVIEHVPQPERLVRELARVLKPNGYLIISTGWCCPYHPEPKDFYRFSPDGLAYLLMQAGLKVVEIVPQGEVFTATLYWWARLFELHAPIVHSVLIKMRLLRILEFLCEYLETRVFAFLSKHDAVGYTVVGRKQ